jgi:hypothetical protein
MNPATPTVAAATTIRLTVFFIIRMVLSFHPMGVAAPSNRSLLAIRPPDHSPGCATG